MSDRFAARIGEVGVAVMTRAPSAPGKTRLAPHLDPSDLRALRTAMLADAVAAASAATPTVAVFCTPDEACDEVAAMAGAPVVPQSSGDLGTRMRRAVEHLLHDGGCAAALVIGSDSPQITAGVLRAAAAQALGGSLVLGPSDDGGYYLIGMGGVEPLLFENLEWGSAAVLAETIRRARARGLRTHLLPPAFDIDTIDDLRRLERELPAWPEAVAPNVRRWFAERRTLNP